MTDRRSFLTAAGLTAVAATTVGASGCSAPQTVGTAAKELTLNVADIPVGSAKIFGDAKLVVSQPTKGDFKAFTSVCTHQGCPVTDVKGNEIICKCHNTAFDVSDGHVIYGPAKMPLTQASVKVDGDNITVTPGK